LFNLTTLFYAKERWDPTSHILIMPALNIQHETNDPFALTLSIVQLNNNKQVTSTFHQIDVG